MGGFTRVDDSDLKNHRDYQRWKKALLETRAGRALWGKWNDGSVTVRIAMGANSGGMAGAVTKDFVFDDDGKLTGVTIVLGTEFAKDAPRNKDAYPVLMALGPENDISREARAIAFLAHEFGHVHHARMLGGAAFRRQDQLLSEHEAGFFTHGWDWFKRPEYHRIVDELGAKPFEVARQREIAADAFAIPVIVDYYQGKPPATVRQAIRSYKETYPLSVAVADTQRTFASDLDVELPKVSFADWFERVVGPDAGIIWQLSECGQRGEDALKETGDIPACVEANAMLPDGRRIIVMTMVGTFRKGVTGAPSFHFGVIDQGGELYPIRRLRDLPKQLSAPWGLVRRPPIGPPDVGPLEVRLSANNAQADSAPAWGLDAFDPITAIAEPPPPAPRPRTEPPPTAPAPSVDKRGVSEGSQGSVIIKAEPTYPPGAEKFNASGPVEVRVTVSETGRVKNAVAISGHLLLRAAAVQAARRWVFTPTTVDGVPVETQIVLTFDFTVHK